jgi:hypothetical protein
MAQDDDGLPGSGRSPEDEAEGVIVFAGGDSVALPKDSS